MNAPVPPPDGNSFYGRGDAGPLAACDPSGTSLAAYTVGNAKVSLRGAVRAARAGVARNGRRRRGRVRGGPVVAGQRVGGRARRGGRPAGAGRRGVGDDRLPLPEG